MLLMLSLEHSLGKSFLKGAGVLMSAGGKGGGGGAGQPVDRDEPTYGASSIKKV